MKTVEKSVGVDEMSNEKKSWRERMHLNRDTLIGGVALGTAAVVTAGAVSFPRGVEKEDISVEKAETSQEISFDLTALQKILIGGNGDFESRGLLDYLVSQGMINPSDKNFLVAYPADIARGNESVEIGKQIAKDAYYKAHERGDHTIMVAFSWGNVPLARAATEIAEANGGVLPPDLTVVAYGGPSGQAGFFESTYGRAASPFLNLFGIPTKDRLPAGAYDVASANDPWASSAHDTWLGQIAKFTGLAGGAHRVPRPDEPRLSWTGSDGVHYERTDVGVHPWTMVASANGLYINDGYNQFFNCLVPVSNGRDPAPDPNARCAIDGLAKAWDEQLGSGQTFQILMSFIPAFPFQIGLDIAHKVPDAVVKGAANIMDPRPVNVPNPLEQISQVPNLENNASILSLDVPEVPQGPANNVVENLQENVEEVVEQLAPSTPVEVPALETPEPLQGLQNAVEGFANAVQNLVPPAPEVPAPAPVEVPVPEPVAVEAPSPAPVPVEVPPVPAPVVVEAPAPAPAPAPVVEVSAPAPAPAPVVEVPAPAPVEVPVPEPVQEVVDAVNGALDQVF